eukprot:31772-Pleurochrysis_carterae.AAC.1
MLAASAKNCRVLCMQPPLGRRAADGRRAHRGLRGPRGDGGERSFACGRQLTARAQAHPTRGT